MSANNFNFVDAALRFAQYFRNTGAGAGGRQPQYAPSQGPFRPAFIPPFKAPQTSEEAQHLYNHIRTVAWYMDALPFLSQAGLPFKFGFDDLISLFPLYGDIVGSVLALYQVFLSWLFGVPLSILGWMIVNVVLDCLLGIIPILGDIMDIMFKANLRNLDLLESWLLRDPQAARFRIYLMPKDEFLPRTGTRRSRRGQQANGRDNYRNPWRTERMKRGQYVPEDLD